MLHKCMKMFCLAPSLQTEEELQSQTKRKRSPKPKVDKIIKPVEAEVAKEAEEVEIVITTHEQANLVRIKLFEYFHETRSEDTTKQILLQKVEDAESEPVTMAQLSSILEDMQETNDVMVVDDQIYKI